MNFIGIWLITIITSVVSEFINELKIFKDVADAGYKLNIEKMNNIQSSISNDTNNNLYLSLMIPFYNMVSVIKRKNTYENNKEMIFEQLDKLGMLDEMTEEEIKEYSKNPIGWNAVIMTANTKKEIKETTKTNANKDQVVQMIIKEEDGQTNIIEVKLDMSTTDDKLEVLKVNGPAENFTKDQLTHYIIEHIDLIMTGKNITCKRKESHIEITLTKTKPKTRLERYIELRDSLTKNGYLYGEEMCEYRELQDEFAPKLKMTK